MACQHCAIRETIGSCRTMGTRTGSLDTRWLLAPAPWRRAPTIPPASATKRRFEQKSLPDVSICGPIARHIDRGRLFGAVSLVSWSTRHIQEQSNVQFSCETDPGRDAYDHTSPGLQGRIRRHRVLQKSVQRGRANAFARSGRHGDARHAGHR